MEKNVLKIASEKEHYEDTNRRLRNIQYTQGLLAAMIVITDALLALIVVAH